MGTPRGRVGSPVEEAMRNSSLRFLAAAALTLLAAAGASAALAAEATGCSGSATSLAADGTTIMSVEAPGPGATQADPFKVDYDGTVQWQGATDAVIQGGSWKVTAMPFTFSGTIANESGKTTADGTVSPADYLPFAIPGLVKVTVDLTGAGGAACNVEGWIQFTGSPLSSPAGWLAVAFTVAGALGLLTLIRYLAHRPSAPVGQNRFGRIVLGLLTGLVLGVGVALLLVMYGVVALGTTVPLIIVGVTVVLGLVLGALPRKMPVAA